MKKHRARRLICGILAFAAIAAVILSIWAYRNTFAYSNLMDEEGRNEALSLLNGQNIPKENIDLFFQLVDEFNSVPYHGIVEHGFKRAAIPFFSYNNENGYAHLNAQESDNIISCRAAAFVLLKDCITFEDTGIVPEEQKCDFPLSETDLENYSLLFANIKYDGDASSETLAEQLLSYWKQAGISFPENGIQLVTAYGAVSNVFQNFHTAAAIYTDECVWLIEKSDPIHPYQLSRFRTQEQMVDYMKKRVSEAVRAAVFSGDVCLWTK